MAATMTYGSEEEKKSLSSSAKTLTEMGNGICHSVLYIVGYKRDGPHAEKTAQGDDRSPGGYLLLWPLFYVGSLRTTSQAQKCWIISILRYIGFRMGLKLAVSMATKLEDTPASFSESAAWFIGEFFPN
jgi:hypothetical protein